MNLGHACLCTATVNLGSKGQGAASISAEIKGSTYVHNFRQSQGSSQGTIFVLIKGQMALRVVAANNEPTVMYHDVEQSTVWL